MSCHATQLVAFRYRGLSLVVLMAIGVFPAISDGVWGQCGSYVILLDDQGRPILNHTSAKPSVTDWAEVQTGYQALRSEPVRKPACQGIQCGQRPAPLTEFPSRALRYSNESLAILAVSDGDLSDDRLRWPVPQDRVPMRGFPSTLLRPPR